MSFLRLLEGVRTPFLDQFFQFITYFGQELIILAVICTLYWCVDKRFAYQLGFTYFTAGLFVQTLKITFRIPRPWILDPGFHPVESAVAGATGYSFPSGHTQGGTSLFAPLALNARKNWQKILCILAFLLIGLSRMYLGVHTPKDVLVSMGISLLFSWLVYHYRSFLVDSTAHIRSIALVLCALSIFVCIYSLLLLSNGTIDTHYASDCCKAGAAGLGFAAGFYLERTYLNFDTHTSGKITQAAKLFIGLGITLFLKSGMKALFVPSIPLKMLEYFILVLWVIVIYPYCFTRIVSSGTAPHK